MRRCSVDTLGYGAQFWQVLESFPLPFFSPQLDDTTIAEDVLVGR